MKQRPPIVCLCGSTRFTEAFREANLRETLAGRIVLTVGCDMRSDDSLGLAPDTKTQLDALHLCKIDLADEVLVLNVGGYIGQSTRRELAYAIAHGKGLRFLEPTAGEAFMERHSHELGRIAGAVGEVPLPIMDEDEQVSLVETVHRARAIYADALRRANERRGGE